MKLSITNKGRISDKDMQFITGGGKDHCKTGFCGTECLTAKFTCGNSFGMCRVIQGKMSCGNGNGGFESIYECENPTEAAFAWLCTTYNI